MRKNSKRLTERIMEEVSLEESKKERFLRGLLDVRFTGYLICRFLECEEDCPVAAKAFFLSVKNRNDNSCREEQFFDDINIRFLEILIGLFKLEFQKTEQEQSMLDTTEDFIEFLRENTDLEKLTEMMEAVEKKYGAEYFLVKKFSSFKLQNRDTVNSAIAALLLQLTHALQVETCDNGGTHE